eukprot:357270-Chlamydomonas_euryale.AAC.20
MAAAAAPVAPPTVLSAWHHPTKRVHAVAASGCGRTRQAFTTLAAGSVPAAGQSHWSGMCHAAGHAAHGGNAAHSGAAEHGGGMMHGGCLEHGRCFLCGGQVSHNGWTAIRMRQRGSRDGGSGMARYSQHVGGSANVTPGTHGQLEPQEVWICAASLCSEARAMLVGQFGIPYTFMFRRDTLHTSHGGTAACSSHVHVCVTSHSRVADRLHAAVLSVYVSRCIVTWPTVCMQLSCPCMCRVT